MNKLRVLLMTLVLAACQTSQQRVVPDDMTAMEAKLLDACVAHLSTRLPVGYETDYVKLNRNDSELVVDYGNMGRKTFPKDYSVGECRYDTNGRLGRAYVITPKGMQEWSPEQGWYL